jgi:GNAT superfamily N-acetyltransferase
MAIIFKNYPSVPGFTETFKEVRDFLIRINTDNLSTPNFVWGRWEWMFSLPYLQTEHLNKIGLWKDDDSIVALATYESHLGDVYYCIDPRYSYLKSAILDYSLSNLRSINSVRILIPDNDFEMQHLAVIKNLLPTDEKEHVAILDIGKSPEYNLPLGFSIVSLSDEYDLKKYNRVLWRGFNHEGPEPTDDDAIESRRISLSGPDVILDLNIAIKAPSGEFVSYSGIWHRPNSKYALVEPVATDPQYRKMGLGKAAVLEASRRCYLSGAEFALVGSNQTFYYSIGFIPYSSETWWKPTQIT